MKFQTNYPIYLQIADDIKRKIIVGELHPGDKLPSNIDLALQYEVNPNTAVRIYKELEQESISFTKRGIGTFLTEDPGMPIEAGDRHKAGARFFGNDAAIPSFQPGNFTNFTARNEQRRGRIIC